MIKENQRLFNQLNVVSDGIIIFSMLPFAFWLRFYVMPGGVISVPFRDYISLDLILTAIHLFTYAAFGLYHNSFRMSSLRKELSKLWTAGVLDMAVLLSVLFIAKGIHYSRLTLALFFFLSICVLSTKRVILRKTLRYLRKKGYNQKLVVLLGDGPVAKSYLRAINGERELGYRAVGYVAKEKGSEPPEHDLDYLGNFEELEKILEKWRPDEVISAIEMEDYPCTPGIVAACEKTGIKLSIIPFYARYMPTNPQFDEVGDIPLMNIRRIPLDNWANAVVKRLMDVIGATISLILFSPVMLVCAIGVRLSSPGPVIFKQERVGRRKKPFYIYKFRSMRLNDAQDTAWSSECDGRRTKFGAFLRKCSLDELPQFWNVLKGEMSLVGPRPELPHFVEQFKEEIPRYMVKHQVRPGITGWAQVNGLRGDTSIKSRVEHDLYYIEHWSILLDIKILFMTIFGGKFLNKEQMN